MKTILTALALSMGFFYASAQNISCHLQKSEVYKTTRDYEKIAAAEEDGKGGAILASRDEKGYNIEHYDASMKLLNEVTYEIDYSVDAGIIVSEGIINILEFVYNKKQKAFICSAITADAASLKFTKKELFSVPAGKADEVAFRMASVVTDGRSFLTIHTNSSKSLIGFYVDIDEKGFDTYNYKKFYVFDMKLNKKIDYNFSPDKSVKSYMYESMEVAEDGSVYLIGKEYNRSKVNEMSQDKFKYQYQLTKLTEADHKTISFDTDKFDAKKVRIVLKKNRVCCVGFYAEKGDWKASGISAFEVDPESLLVTVSKFTPFTSSFLTEKYGKEKKEPIPHLEVKDVFLTANNDIIFNAEEQNQYEKTLFFNDIVSARIADNGDVVWMRNINKRQSTIHKSRGLGYTCAIKGEDTYFFINTDEDVKQLKDGRIEFKNRRESIANLNVVKIDGQGNFTFKELLDNEDHEVYFAMKNGIRTGNGENVYFFGSKGSKKQFLKISL